MNAANILELISLRDSAHLRHWATTSYAEHKAIGGFYDGLTDLLDTFMETYQGKYGRLFIGGIIAPKAFASLEIVNNTMSEVEAIEKGIKDSDLLNILADMKQLCNHTKYKLSLT